MISNIESQLLPVRFSIIIPIYNAAQYLRRTLASVSGQSFTDFEAILINDGSTDSSLDICREFAREDKRFKVIDVKNGGVSKARNLGLRKAQGEYICFLDADDRVLPNWLKYYVAEEKVDLLCQGCVEVSKTRVVCSFSDEILTDNLSEALTVMQRKGLLNPPWSKCYKAEVINRYGLSFQENCHLFEDLIFSLQYLQHVRSVKLIKYAGYEYQREFSVLTKRYNNPLDMLSWSQKVVEEALRTVGNRKETSFYQTLVESQLHLLSYFVIDHFSKIQRNVRYQIYQYLHALRKQIEVPHKDLKSSIFYRQGQHLFVTDALASIWGVIYRIADVFK